MPEHSSGEIDIMFVPDEICVGVHQEMAAAWFQKLLNLDDVALPNLRLQLNSIPRSAVTSWNVSETLRVVPFDRWWCRQEALSSEVHISELSAGLSAARSRLVFEPWNLSYCKPLGEECELGILQKLIGHHISEKLAGSSIGNGGIKRVWHYVSGPRSQFVGSTKIIQSLSSRVQNVCSNGCWTACICQ